MASTEAKRIRTGVPAYDASSVLTGEVDRALETAVVVLVAAGFRLVGKTTSSAELTASPTIAQQNPLLGASRLRISFQEGRISVAAELGGVAYLGRLVHIVPMVGSLVLCVVLGVIFTLAFDEAQGSAARNATLAVLLVQVLILAVIGPLLARRLEARTCKAIDTFVASIRVIAADL